MQLVAMASSRGLLPVPVAGFSMLRSSISIIRKVAATTTQNQNVNAPPTHPLT